jgi:hypothetical protein
MMLFIATLNVAVSEAVIALVVFQLSVVHMMSVGMVCLENRFLSYAALI